jgi:hypothetical protein
MGIFDGIEQTSYFARSKNILEGTHILVGRKITVQQSSKNRAVSNFIMEFTVESTDNPELAVGDVVAAIYSSSKDSFLGNVKYLLATYMLACERSGNPDITAKDVDAKINTPYIAAITEGDGTAYAGFRIKCVGTVKEIKNGPNAGQPFTRHDWFQVGE